MIIYVDASCSIGRPSQRLLILGHLCHEDILRVLVLYELVHHLDQSCRLELVTQLGHKLETLVEVQHIHVGEDALLLLRYDAKSDGVEAHLVHILLQVGYLGSIQDRLTLCILIVILTAEVFE